MFGTEGENPKLFDRFPFQVEEEIKKAMAGLGIADPEVQVVTVTGESDLFKDVDIDGGWHWRSVLCVWNRYALRVVRYVEHHFGFSTYNLVLSLSVGSLFRRRGTSMLAKKMTKKVSDPILGV